MRGFEPLDLGGTVREIEVLSVYAERGKGGRGWVVIGTNEGDIMVRYYLSRPMDLAGMVMDRLRGQYTAVTVDDGQGGLTVELEKRNA